MNCVLVDNPYYSDTAWKYIIPNAAFNVDITTQFDANCFPTALDNISKHAYTIFPNPTYGNIQIESPTNGSYQLLNMNGKILLSADLGIGKTSVDLSNLSAGVYSIIIMDNSNNTFYKKLIKE